MADEKMTLEVFRYNPEKDTEPRFQNYEVPYQKDWVILDALNWVKDNVDGTLTYRWSCRMGVCGSCGMQINGVPKLTCAVFLKDYYPNPIKVEPLANFPVIRDLVIEMDGFMEKLQSVKPWIIDDDEPPLSEGAYKQTPAQLANYKQFSMCINCMLCYAACPVVALEPDFLGPAAIALGQRYNLDSRDKGNKERNEVIFSHEGIWDCTFVGECTEVCPKKVDPAGAIQQAKVDGAIDMVKSVLMPWGQK